MSGVHAGGVHGLHLPGSTPVHRLVPEAKLLGLTAFVVAAAVTPRHAVPVLLVDGAVLVAVAAIARIPVATFLTRLAVIAPFVLAALVIPFVADGPTTSVAGASLSTEGLWATWNVIAKATLGAGAAIVMSATTPLPSMIDGLSRLRLPHVLVAIVAAMVRYLDLLAAQLGRMRRAMTARGHDPRWLWQVRPVASSVGLLFVRSYERGERVHRAMLARGYDGTVVVEDERPGPSPAQWAAALLPAVIGVGALVVWLVTARTVGR